MPLSRNLSSLSPHPLCLFTGNEWDMPWPPAEAPSSPGSSSSGPGLGSDVSSLPAALLARAKTSPLLPLKASPSLPDFAGEQRCRPPFPAVPLLSLCFALPLSTPYFFCPSRSQAAVQARSRPDPDAQDLAALCPARRRLLSATADLLASSASPLREEDDPAPSPASPLTAPPPPPRSIPPAWTSARAQPRLALPRGPPHPQLACWPM